MWNEHCDCGVIRYQRNNPRGISQFWYFFIYYIPSCFCKNETQISPVSALDFLLMRAASSFFFQTFLWLLFMHASFHTHRFFKVTYWWTSSVGTRKHVQVGLPPPVVQNRLGGATNSLHWMAANIDQELDGWEICLLSQSAAGLCKSIPLEMTKLVDDVWPIPCGT